MNYIEYAYDLNGIIVVGQAVNGDTIRIPSASKDYTLSVIKEHVPLNHTVFIDDEGNDRFTFRFYAPTSRKDKEPDLSFMVNLVGDKDFIRLNKNMG